MKTIDEQVQDVLTEIARREGGINELNAKLARLLKQKHLKPTNESAQGSAQLLQE